MAVHNHGTPQADGPICSESLIGDCLIKEGSETIEGLREQIQSRPLLCNMAKRLQSEVSNLAAERDGLLATVTAALAATKRGNIATPPWVIAALTTSPAESLATHDAEIAAKAWHEGHLLRWRRGVDDCHCSARSAGECGCGRYGTGEMLSLADNPYSKTTESETNHE